jgi:predicted RNA-binding protein with TRAM domain
MSSPAPKWTWSSPKPPPRTPATEGIAKIAGLVVVVEGASTIGERVNVRIADRKDRIAFAELTGKPAGTGPLPVSVEPVRRVFRPAPGDSAGHVVAGAELDVVVTEASSKNPTTEGVARIGGLVVFVQGVTAIGERVNVRITDRRERIAFAEPTGKPAGTGPLPAAGTGEVIRRAFSPGASDPAGHVVAGAEMDVVIVEASEKNPATEGVAKISGLVVFVQGATTLGERVNVRITARRERMAFAEPTGKPAGTDPLPVSAAPARAPRAPRAFAPGPRDTAAHVVPGAVIATTITELSKKNPTTEGVARINGLVLFVKGAATLGQPVNVRILERRERIATGEATTDAPTAPTTP